MDDQSYSLVPWNPVLDVFLDNIASLPYTELNYNTDDV